MTTAKKSAAKPAPKKVDEPEVAGVTPAFQRALDETSDDEREVLLSRHELRQSAGDPA